MPKLSDSTSQDSINGSRRRHKFSGRQTEDIRVQELKKAYARLFIASASEPSHQVKPVLAVQFLLATFLITSKSFCVTSRSSSPKGLPLKNLPHLCLFVGYALTTINSRISPNIGAGGAAQVSLQFFSTLKLGQLGSLSLGASELSPSSRRYPSVRGGGQLLRANSCEI